MTKYKDLPVYRHRNQILQALTDNQVIVVESPTGSGKTTQIPLILKDAGYAESGVIGIFRNNRLQYLMHEATSNISAAINTSSNAGAVVVVKVVLYIKFSSSMRAASSEALILRVTCLCSDSLIPFEKSL